MAGEIFISYRRADEAWARLLCSQLKAEGVDAWYDAQVGAGQDWRTATAKALEDSRVFVLLFSRAAAESPEIAKELAAATVSKKLIVPVRIENIRPSGAFLYELAGRNWVNAFENTEASLAELAHCLARQVKSGAADDSVLSFNRNAGGAPASRRSGSAIRPWLLAAAALLVLAAGAAIFFRRPPPPTELRIAMLPFDVLSEDRDLSFFAAGLVDEIGVVLAKNQLQTIPRSQVAALPPADREAALTRLGATLHLGGTVRHDGPMINVTVHLDNARGHVTIWNEEFSRPAGEISGLEGEVAAATTSAALGVRDNERYGLDMNDVQTMTGMLRAFDLLNDHNDYQQGRRIMQQLVARAPEFSLAHSRLAIASMGVAREVPADQAGPLLAEAESEAKRALELNPDVGEAYLALAYLRPNTDWRGREALLLKGGNVDPNWPYLPYHVSKHLWSVGDLAGALPVDERGLALMPFHLALNAQKAIELASLGRLREAGESVDRVVSLWPSAPRSRQLRFWFTVFFRPPDEALALLGNPESRPADLEPVAIEAWRGFIEANRSGDAARKARASEGLVRAADDRRVDRGNAVQALAILGDIDGAFAQMSRYVDEAGGYHRGMLILPPAILFFPTTATMRRDPRFMPFAAKLGLVEYWQKTAKWPNFCSEPGLPYDCREAAASIAP